MNVKESVKDNRVRFLRYRQAVMYYSVAAPGSLGSTCFLYRYMMLAMRRSTLRTRR